MVLPGIPPEWIIFYSNSFNAAVIFTNRECATISNLVLDNAVFVSLNVNNDKIFIGSQYSSPSGNIDKDFEDIGEHFQNFDKVLLAGDFNVPLLDLGYTRQTERTDVFLEHLLEKDLRIINDTDAAHTFVQGSLKGRPDLTLGGLEICRKIDNWYVDEKNYSFSDHRYIRYSLGYVASKKTNQRYKTKNKSFRKFNDNIKKKEEYWLNELLKIKNTEDLEKHVNQFVEEVSESQGGMF